MISAKQKTILLVEDDAVIALNESIELKDHGYNVLPVLNSHKAIEAVSYNNPVIDLILMDIDLGNNLDGTEVARIILKNHDIPLLFLSSHTEREVVDKTGNIKFYGYISKDSGFSVLDASIKMALKLHEAYQVMKNQKLEIECQKKDLQAKVSAKNLAQKIVSESEEKYRNIADNLSKLNETKDKFISIVSHDLRTPFSSILGFSDLLIENDDLTEIEKKKYAGFIKESSKTMLDLVNSLLDLTRLKTGRMKFEPEKISARMIINNCVNSLSGLAIQKNINIKSKVDDKVIVYADHNLISQLFNNMISNAIKFTNAGGEIIISVSPYDKLRSYEFSIKDNGIGIKPEKIPELFRIDTKYTSEGTAGEKGTGIGLSIVKEIIEKHGGNIRVESEFGKGTDFKFTLPVASPNILLVDDSKNDRILYSKIIKNMIPDYNIEIASNGKEALEIIKSTPPALVITDHLMPEMNGYDLSSEIKKLKIKVKPQVIILSSDINGSLMVDYHNLGIEYVFTKPVNLILFKSAVEKLLRKNIVV